MGIVETAALEDAKGLFDGVEVRAVGWQKEHLMTILCGDLAEPVFAVERRVVGHNHARIMQLGDKMELQPIFDHQRIATARKQHGRHLLLNPLSHDEIGAVFLGVTSLLTKHFRAARCPRIGVEHRLLKAAFIKINNVLFTIKSGKLAQLLQELNP